MNPYTKEQWREYEQLNKEKRNARRRELYRKKIMEGYNNVR